MCYILIKKYQYISLNSKMTYINLDVLLGRPGSVVLFLLGFYVSHLEISSMIETLKK